MPLNRSLICATGVLLILHIYEITGGEGVRIKQLATPGVVLNGTGPAVLDCDYALTDTQGLVLKWFFNNHPAPVYQWILGQKPQDMGILKGKVDLSYKATNDEATVFRAIKIPIVTTELSGEYKCLVSTFEKEDSKSNKMIVYVPEKTFEMTQEKTRDDQVRINCTVQGIFPEPNITVWALDNNKEPDHSFESKRKTNASVWDAVASLTMDDADLAVPTTFCCRIGVPEAKYENQKQLVYFPAAGSRIAPSLSALFVLSLSMFICTTAL